MAQETIEKTAPEEDSSAEQKSEPKSREERKKKALKAGVAAVTSAGVLLGGLFSSPDALLAPEQDLNPVAIVQNDNDGDDLDSGDDGESEEQEERRERTGLRAALRQRILRLPLAVRVFVLVPLWALGWGIWTAASGLWTMLLGPIAGKAVSWLFLLAALLGAAALGMKAIFPNMPLKKIFNKKSLLGLLLGGLGLGVADLTVPMFWDGYEALAHGGRGRAAPGGAALDGRGDPGPGRQREPQTIKKYEEPPVRNRRLFSYNVFYFSPSRRQITRATPASLLLPVISSAAAFTLGSALAMATPNPAARSMARSLVPSPKATVSSRRMPRCSASASSALSLPAFTLLISMLLETDVVATSSGKSSGMRRSCRSRSSRSSGLKNICSFCSGSPRCRRVSFKSSTGTRRRFTISSMCGSVGK